MRIWLTDHLDLIELIAREFHFRTDVDSPWFSGPFLKAYHRMYRQTYATKGWRKLMRLLPTLHIYDDHEVSPTV